ncbi:MAG: hypothetical protein MMC23_002390 [Stictis urceolatum]|nr:hypothetical protein [Stictis urceolata]
MTRLTEQLKAEQGLASELADLRVAKANTDQALMNLQTHLEHKSRKVTELEGIINKLEKEHSAMSEEAQLLRSRPRQNPELLTQIVDLQSRKSSLEREVMQAQGIANQQKLTIENYEKEKNQLQARSESLQSRLQSSESRCIEVEKQQTEFDQKLEAQVGKIRTQLTQATNEDKSRWHSKCMGAMHDAQSKSTLLEGKITQLDQELANVRGNNSNQAAQAERLNKELTNAKAELEHERETAHRDAELIKQLQQEKSTRAESHKKDIEQFQRRLTEQSNLRVEAEEKLEQQRNGMKAQEQECLNLIEDRLHALECGDNECPSGILHTMSLDIIMALRDLIARESSSKDKFIAMHKAQLVKAHAQLGDIDEQFDEDGDSLDFAEDNHDASRELEPTTKESQELPYNGAAQQASGRSSTQEESQELPYMGDASRVSRNSNYTPMRGLMQRDHRSSFERNGEDQGDTPGHGTGKTLQDANHYVEESQYSRRVWHGQASDVAVAPLTAGTLNQLNPISFKGQAEGLKRIEEATSPVGDTQGLFPLTPMPRDTPHSGSSVRSQGTAPRANTGKVLNNNQGPAHRSANDAAKTPNRPLQVLDTNRMVPTSPAGIPIGRDPPNIKSARPRRLKNSVQNGSVGTQGNKFKSGKANADEKGGSAEMQPPQTDPGPVSNSQLIASLKRKSLGTDPITDSSNTSKSRRRKVETEDLGPVIGTSTSPGVSSSGKTGHGQARKSMRRKSQGR